MTPDDPDSLAPDDEPPSTIERDEERRRSRERDIALIEAGVLTPREVNLRNGMLLKIMPRKGAVVILGTRRDIARGRAVPVTIPINRSDDDD